MKVKDRPKYSKWRRKAGGVKVCPNRECRHRHKPVMRIEGTAVRPKNCIKCGRTLPGKLTYPKKGAVTWIVREFDQATGKTQDFTCPTGEAADELIARMQRDFTRDPVQAQLVEHASVLARQIEASDLDEAISQLIVKLGGDASALTVKDIGWDEARDMICASYARKASPKRTLPTCGA